MIIIILCWRPKRAGRNARHQPSFVGLNTWPSSWCVQSVHISRALELHGRLFLNACKQVVELFLEDQKKRIWINLIKMIGNVQLQLSELKKDQQVSLRIRTVCVWVVFATVRSRGEESGSYFNEQVGAGERERSITLGVLASWVTGGNGVRWETRLSGSHCCVFMCVCV